MPSKTDINCIRLAGEFFVAAEFSKRGFCVGLTFGNARAADLLVEKNGRAVPI